MILTAACMAKMLHSDEESRSLTTTLGVAVAGLVLSPPRQCLYLLLLFYESSLFAGSMLQLLL